MLACSASHLEDGWRNDKLVGYDAMEGELLVWAVVGRGASENAEEGHASTPHVGGRGYVALTHDFWGNIRGCSNCVFMELR
jgi:hypothetical protein